MYLSEEEREALENRLFTIQERMHLRDDSPSTYSPTIATRQRWKDECLDILFALGISITDELDDILDILIKPEPGDNTRIIEISIDTILDEGHDLSTLESEIALPDISDDVIDSLSETLPEPSDIISDRAEHFVYSNLFMNHEDSMVGKSLPHALESYGAFEEWFIDRCILYGFNCIRYTPYVGNKTFTYRDYGWSGASPHDVREARKRRFPEGVRHVKTRKRGKTLKFQDLLKQIMSEDLIPDSDTAKYLVRDLRYLEHINDPEISTSFIRWRLPGSQETSGALKDVYHRLVLASKRYLGRLPKHPGDNIRSPAVFVAGKNIGRFRNIIEHVYRETRDVIGSARAFGVSDSRMREYIRLEGLTYD